VGGIAGEVVNNGANLLYYHKDQLGSVTAVSGGNSEVDSYDAWGKRRMTNGGDDTTCYVSSVAIRGYIAEEQNAPSCPLINLNARMYDPITTRFLSPDPKGLAAGPNPYTYAANNPLTYKDPTGLDCVDEGCGLGPYEFSPYISFINPLPDPVLEVIGGVSDPPVSAPAENAVQTDQTSDPTPQSDDQTGSGATMPGQSGSSSNGGGGQLIATVDDYGRVTGYETMEQATAQAEAMGAAVVALTGVGVLVDTLAVVTVTAAPEVTAAVATDIAADTTIPEVVVTASEHSEATIGDILSGYHPDTLIHLTPDAAADFEAGVDLNTFFARLGDVSHMTVPEYQAEVVGTAAAAGPGQSVAGFVLANPGVGGFTQAGIFNNALVMEYTNSVVFYPSGFIPLP
jgi:RHS repeat-associated protein